MGDSTKLVYDIEFDGEPAAGLSPYYNRVTIEVDYDPGGEPGEFAEECRLYLGEWFSGARVRPVDLPE